MNTLSARVTLVITILGGPAFAGLTLTSSDLKQDTPINTAHIYPRCGGRNLSPQLSWSGAPQSAKSLVLTMIDVDVKPAQWSHWVVVGLPVSPTSLHRAPRRCPAMPKPWSVILRCRLCRSLPSAGTGAHHYQFTICLADGGAIAPS